MIRAASDKRDSTTRLANDCISVARNSTVAALCAGFTDNETAGNKCMMLRLYGNLLSLPGVKKNTSLKHT